MNGSGLQVGQAHNGHWLVDYTTADQYGFTAPRCQSVCEVADIIGKLDGLSWIKGRFT